MTVKVAEKKFLLGLILLIASIVVFIQGEIFTTQEIISGKGLICGVISISLFVLAIRLCERSFAKR